MRAEALRGLDYPPVWLAGFLFFMFALSRLVPGVAIPSTSIGGGAVIVAAIALMIWSAVTLLRRGTTVIPRRAPSALTTTGPFAISRNPIYLADLLILIGYALTTGALTPWILIPFFPLLIARRFIRGEEATLRDHFGDAFDLYAARVRRWI